VPIAFPPGSIQGLGHDLVDQQLVVLDALRLVLAQALHRGPAEGGQPAEARDQFLAHLLEQRPGQALAVRVVQG
jgi:hypothetical protein